MNGKQGRAYREQVTKEMMMGRPRTPSQEIEAAGLERQRLRTAEADSVPIEELVSLCRRLWHNRDANGLEWKVATVAAVVQIRSVIRSHDPHHPYLKEDV